MAEQDLTPPAPVLIDLNPSDPGQIALDQKIRTLRPRSSAQGLPTDAAADDTPAAEAHPKLQVDANATDAEPEATVKPPGRRRDARGALGVQWIIGLTCLTALAAVVAMVFTGLQWWEVHAGFARTEQQAAQGLAAAAQTQANAARDEVNAIKEQAVISKDLLALTQKAADAQQKAAALAALDTEPFIAVDQLQLSTLRSPADRHGRTRVALRYRFANVGKQIGYLKAISAALYVGKDLPPRPTYQTPIPYSMELPPGSVLINTSSVSFELPVMEMRNVIAGRKTAFLVGYVDYKDASDATHRLCFAYAMDFKGKTASQTFVGTGPDAYRCDGA